MWHLVHHQRPGVVVLGLAPRDITRMARVRSADVHVGRLACSLPEFGVRFTTASAGMLAPLALLSVPVLTRDEGCETRLRIDQGLTRDGRQLEPFRRRYRSGPDPSEATPEVGMILGSYGCVAALVVHWDGTTESGQPERSHAVSPIGGVNTCYSTSVIDDSRPAASGRPMESRIPARHQQCPASDMDLPLGGISRLDTVHLSGRRSCGQNLREVYGGATDGRSMRESATAAHMTFHGFEGALMAGSAPEHNDDGGSMSVQGVGSAAGSWCNHDRTRANTFREDSGGRELIAQLAEGGFRDRFLIAASGMTFSEPGEAAKEVSRLFEPDGLAPDPQELRTRIAILTACLPASIDHKERGLLLGMIGWLWWWQGERTRAQTVAHHARTQDREQHLAGLVLAALRTGLSPGWLARRRRTLSTD